jgi:hypothetical protein
VRANNILVLLSYLPRQQIMLPAFTALPGALPARTRLRARLQPQRGAWGSTCSASRFSAGDAVRVAGKPLLLYHLASARNEPFDVQGMEGTVFNVIDEVAGSPISATKPVVVKFVDPKFMAHFDDDELEPVE